VHRSRKRPLMSEWVKLGHSPDVGSMSGSPESGHGTCIGTAPTCRSVIAAIRGTEFMELSASIFVGIWKAKPKGTTVSRLIRARCELRISCSVGISSDGVARCKHCACGVRQLPRFHSSVRKDHPHCADLVFSLALISFLFAAIYKVLPHRDVEWGDVWHRLGANDPRSCLTPIQLVGQSCCRIDFSELCSEQKYLS
jgi:hypothetical protein